MQTKAVILAAGQGTRMVSKMPKVLHPLMGRPLISYSVELAERVTGVKPVVVIGHGSELVREVLGKRVVFVEQEPQLGTGHALQQAQGLLKGDCDQVLVISADMPLLRAITLDQIINTQMANSGPLTMLTLRDDDSRGFGRVIRDPSGMVSAIVEEAQATPAELEHTELNAGIYCFDSKWVWDALAQIELSPKGEYYLTDLIAIAVADRKRVRAIECEDGSEAIGVNNRAHLADAAAILQQRINLDWMLAGVTIMNPASTYIEPGVQIGSDTVIWPNTFLRGSTQIGEGCEVGPDTMVRDTQIGNGCRVFYSVLENARLEDQVEIGPYGHLRKGAHLAQGVHMGNFGEIKNSYLGPGTKMGHFSYIGDTTMGASVNIGAGTVTCNYDGERKHPTEIGSGSFIGSGTMLVAPLKLGENSITGAGSVVTKDVSADTLVAGVPARAIRKLKK